VPVIGGFIPSSFVSLAYPSGSDDIYLALGGYEGAPLGSGGYLGWSLLAVLAAGTAAFWRDRRLWFFGFVLAFSVYCSLGVRKGQAWVPAQVFARLPVLENVIQQRFIAIGFLAAAVMLAIVLDRVHALLPDWRGLLAGVAVAAVALVPMGVAFGDRLPFAMRPVILPRWYTSVAPSLPPGRVLLSYPAPFSGIQSAMAWQAVDSMHYSQAGGGGPQGVASRAGVAAPGFRVLTDLTFGLGAPLPTGTPAEDAAVRQALRAWRVDSVVISTNTAAPLLQQGHDPVYAAAFMTGVLGRLPHLQAGAWVWDHVQQGLGQRRPLRTARGVLDTCVGRAEGPSGLVVASMKAPVCVGLQALAQH
jgi:hypothetical protein